MLVIRDVISGTNSDITFTNHVTSSDVKMAAVAVTANAGVVYVDGVVVTE